MSAPPPWTTKYGMYLPRHPTRKQQSSSRESNVADLASHTFHAQASAHLSERILHAQAEPYKQIQELAQSSPDNPWRPTELAQRSRGTLGATCLEAPVGSLFSKLCSKFHASPQGRRQCRKPWVRLSCFFCLRLRSRTRVAFAEWCACLRVKGP